MNDVCTHCKKRLTEHRQVLNNACCPDGGNVFASRRAYTRRKKRLALKQEQKGKAAKDAVKQIKDDRAAKIVDEASRA